MGAVGWEAVIEREDDDPLLELVLKELWRARDCARCNGPHATPYIHVVSRTTTWHDHRSTHVVYVYLYTEV